MRIPKRFKRAELYYQHPCGFWVRPIRGMEVHFALGPYRTERGARIAAGMYGLRVVVP